MILNGVLSDVYCFTEQPAAPEAPEATRITDDSITLFWKSPEDNGNSTITEYILEYQEKSKKK